VGRTRVAEVLADGVLAPASTTVARALAPWGTTYPQESGIHSWTANGFDTSKGLDNKPVGI